MNKLRDYRKQTYIYKLGNPLVSSVGKKLLVKMTLTQQSVYLKNKNILNDGIPHEFYLSSVMTGTSID